jgi:hypothetical protein
LQNAFLAEGSKKHVFGKVPKKLLDFGNFMEKRRNRSGSEKTQKRGHPARGE